MATLKQLHSQGSVHSIPYKKYHISDIEKALLHFTKETRTSKIVVTYDEVGAPIRVSSVPAAYRESDSTSISTAHRLLDLVSIQTPHICLLAALEDSAKRLVNGWLIKVQGAFFTSHDRAATEKRCRASSHGSRKRVLGRISLKVM